MHLPRYLAEFVYRFGRFSWREGRQVGRMNEASRSIDGFRDSFVLRWGERARGVVRPNRAEDTDQRGRVQRGIEFEPRLGPQRALETRAGRG